MDGNAREKSKSKIQAQLDMKNLQRQLDKKNGESQEYLKNLERQLAERMADLVEINQRLREQNREHERTQILLREQEQKFRTLAENSPDPIYRYDRHYRRLYVNPVVGKIIGKPVAELIGRSPADGAILISDQSKKLIAAIQKVFDSGETGNIEVDFINQEGCSSVYHMLLVPERDTTGQIISTLCLARDVTDRKRVEELLRIREQEFRTLVENSPDTIARYDENCRRVYANPSLIRLSGGGESGILGKTPTQFPGGVSASKYEQRILEVFRTGEERYCEFHWRATNADICSHVRLIPEFDNAGMVKHVLAVGRDITEIDLYRKKINRQALYDTLTDLPNRSLLSDRIRGAIGEASRHRSQFGLMILDLDRFKEVNDSLGHEAGDQLLCEASQRLQALIRSQDTMARLGGDEFAMLIPGVRSSIDLGVVADKMLNALSAPFVIGGREIFISVSIGIALYPIDSVEVDALFKFADSAMYHAKKQGRNNFQYYVKELTARSSERLEIEAALHKARKRGELELHYQPQVDLSSGRITGAEALLRWNRPGYNVVMPDRFISIAEDSGLIVDIGEWVLRTACTAAADWNRERSTSVKMAVNLSTRQFLRNDLVASLRNILFETGCKAEWLELEITESLLLEDSQEIAEMLREMHAMGLSISIDDFGTGYSALSYLNKFPVSQIKIDRSFIMDIPANRDKSELVKAMLSISTALRLEVVAEGVETPAQVEYLLAHDCKLAQGYLFGKPMAHDKFTSMLQSACKT